MQTFYKEQDNTLHGIACILSQIQTSNDEFKLYQYGCSPFIGLQIPDIEIADYCTRLQKYFKCSPACFVVALIYIDRLVESQLDGITINARTVHRLLITGLTIAVKFWEDAKHSNRYYAQVGGIELKQLNFLESYMLSALGFSLHLDEETTTTYFTELRVHPGRCEKCQKVMEKTHQQETKITKPSPSGTTSPIITKSVQSIPRSTPYPVCVEECSKDSVSTDALRANIPVC